MKEIPAAPRVLTGWLQGCRACRADGLAGKLSRFLQMPAPLVLVSLPCPAAAVAASAVAISEGTFKRRVRQGAGEDRRHHPSVHPPICSLRSAGLMLCRALRLLLAVEAGKRVRSLNAINICRAKDVCMERGIVGRESACFHGWGRGKRCLPSETGPWLSVGLALRFRMLWAWNAGQGACRCRAGLPDRREFWFGWLFCFASEAVAVLYCARCQCYVSEAERKLDLARVGDGGWMTVYGARCELTRRAGEQAAGSRPGV
ncbi:hypothetical protein BKA81DRAFT_97704 [Phyllosticta paracitricarpa]|uniref:Uncharacterized protein n=1 Tax=Phyllosticta paracitricarpa TaxID=2016321 RepID=A0ABR1NAB4_9PEZI